jgi:hypothetical protein
MGPENQVKKVLQDHVTVEGNPDVLDGGPNR